MGAEQPVKAERQRLMDNWDRWRGEFTDEQNAAVAAVLFLTDEKPDAAHMEHYRRLAEEHGWVSDV